MIGYHVFDAHPDARGSTVYGGNRRPSRRDMEFRPDPAELAEWTAANRRARRAYDAHLAYMASPAKYRAWRRRNPRLP